MVTATPKYEVFSYERLAMNGGTSIYQAKEKQSPLTDQLKVTKNIGRSRTKTKLWLSEQIDNGNFGQPTTAMYGTDQVRW